MDFVGEDHVSMENNQKEGESMKKQQSIYIAGSISNDPDYISKFDAAEKKLQETFSGRVVNPVKECQKEFAVPEQMPWDTLMLHVLRKLSGCTHIYMLQDYYRSTGACIELEWARKLGISIIYEKEPPMSKRV